MKNVETYLHHNQTLLVHNTMNVVLGDTTNQHLMLNNNNKAKVRLIAPSYTHIERQKTQTSTYWC